MLANESSGGGSADDRDSKNYPPPAIDVGSPGEGASVGGNTKFLESHQFVTPTRAVKTPEDMKLWENSEAYFEYLGLINSINEAVKGKPLSHKLPLSRTVIKFSNVLVRLDSLINDIPPVEQPQRFGNKAFKTWLEKVKDSSIELLQEALVPNLHNAVPEIAIYFNESFGNPTRIDYGTGHEMAFIMFLCCLYKIGALVESDLVPTCNQIFLKYLKLVRKLQVTYRMEPAGSHGVWSLDDYQFVPFIWGSSQLVGHPQLEPHSFTNPEIVNENADSYMFMGCIRHIMTVKIGPFAEHSNQLWGVSGVSTWSKINSGLIKMYKAEVLAKFPVIQHVLFGSLLPFTAASRKPQFIHRISHIDPVIQKQDEKLSN